MSTGGSPPKVLGSPFKSPEASNTGSGVSKRQRADTAGHRRPITDNSEPRDHMLELAIEEVESEDADRMSQGMRPREAGWYGPYTKGLSSSLEFYDLGAAARMGCIVPQYPVTHKWEHDDDEASSLPQTSTATPNNPKTPGPHTPNKTITEKSTRVPDFVRKLYFVKGEQPARTVKSVVDLIIEIKRSPKHYEEELLLIHPQVQEQAFRTFAEYECLQDVGCIIAVGKYWRYIEWTKPNNLRSFLEDSGSDYQPTPSTSYSITPSQDSPPLTEEEAELRRVEGLGMKFDLFEDVVKVTPGKMPVFVLGTEDSAKALGIVKRRLRSDLNASVWLGTWMH